MIVEFLEDVPIPDSRKSFKAGTRMVFEHERGEGFVKKGQAREVKKLYLNHELDMPVGGGMADKLDALVGEPKKKNRTKPKKDKP